MDLMKMGTDLLMNKLKGGQGSGVTSALIGLVGNSSSGGLDIAGLVNKFSGSGGSAASPLASWLGDGQNEAISSDKIKEVFGNEKISQFASQLGMDEDSAANKLAEIVPDMIDKASSGGNLLDSASDIAGTMKKAKNLMS